MEREYLVESVFHALCLYSFHCCMEFIVHYQFQEDKHLSRIVRDSKLQMLLIFGFCYLVNRFVGSKLQFVVAIITTVALMQIIVGQSTYGEMLRVPLLSSVQLYLLYKLPLRMAFVAISFIAIYLIFN